MSESKAALEAKVARLERELEASRAVAGKARAESLRQSAQALEEYAKYDRRISDLSGDLAKLRLYVSTGQRAEAQALDPQPPVQVAGSPPKA